MGPLPGSYATDTEPRLLLTQFGDDMALFGAHANIKYDAAIIDGNSFIAVQGSGVGAHNVMPEQIENWWVRLCSPRYLRLIGETTCIR